MAEVRSREQTIFEAARQIGDGAARAAYVEQACGDDDALRQRVGKLLHALDDSASFLETPPTAVANAADTARRAAPDPPSLGFLSPPDGPDSLGRLGHYEVLEVVGSGGMGIVLRAFDDKLRRVVAIKVMAAELATTAAARKRFTREAQAAAAVRNDHVVNIHAVEEAQGLPYLVMEFISGVSLQERLDQSGPLELHEILRIGMQIAQGLAAAHAQGLVHRDIKPANILLENGVERVKITDFGLARAANDASLTQSGLIAGTPHYMAPEQVHGEPLDHRTDLFSLGSVLYALCTGRTPFRGSTAIAVLKRVCEDQPSPVCELNSQIPDWLEAIVVRLLAKNPAERFQTAEEVAELLGRHLAHLQQPALSPFPGPAAGPAPRAAATGRSRWLAVALALAAAVGLAGLSEATGVTGVAQTVIRVAVGEGTLVIEADDPSVRITIDGEEIRIHGAGVQEVRLRPGSYQVQASKDGQRVPLDKEVVMISRGGRDAVKVTLEGPSLEAEAAKGRSESNELTVAAVPLEVTELRPLEGHADPVHAIAFTPDGRQLLTAGGERWDGSVRDKVVAGTDFSLRLWDVATGEQVRQLEGHKGPVFALAISADGRRALSGGGDLMVYLWDVETGERLASFQGHTQQVRSVAFLPGRELAVSTAFDGTTRVWDLATGSQQKLLEQRATRCWTLAVSPDGRHLAVGGGRLPLAPPGSDFSISVWTTATFEKIKSLDGHEYAVRGLAFTSDGRRLISGSPDVMVVWDVNSGAQLDRFLQASNSKITDLKRLDNDRYVATTTTGDNGLRLIDLQRCEVVWSQQRANGTRLCVAVSPDTRLLASGSWGESVVRLWQLPESVCQIPEGKP